jgi:hypothetical protein
VLVKGTWGIRGESARHGRRSPTRRRRGGRHRERQTRRISGKRSSSSRHRRSTTSWKSSFEKDPFEVPAEEKTQLSSRDQRGSSQR